MTNDQNIPRGSKAFERKLNEAAAAGVQQAIDNENRRNALRDEKSEKAA